MQSKIRTIKSKGWFSVKKREYLCKCFVFCRAVTSIITNLVLVKESRNGSGYANIIVGWAFTILSTFCSSWKAISQNSLLVIVLAVLFLSLCRDSASLIQGGLIFPGSDLASGKQFFLYVWHLFTGLAALPWYALSCWLGVRHHFYLPLSISYLIDCFVLPVCLIVCVWSTYLSNAGKADCYLSFFSL